MTAFYYRVIAIFWTIFIIVVSGLSKGTISSFNLDDLLSMDKLAHAFVYGMYVVLWGLAERRDVKLSVTGWIFLTSVALGLLMEVLQATIFVGRYFEYYDIIANISGSIIGLILFNKLIKN